MLYQTENPHGGDIYSGEIRLDFSASINPLGTPKSVREAVCESVSMLDRYPDPYCRKLVAAISAHENVPQDYILCANGAAELIYAFAAAVSPKSVVIPAPSFSEYAQSLCNANIQYYPLKSESNFQLDRVFLNYLKESQPDAVYLCSPNNPTGRLIDLSILDEILSLGTRLFLDECFLDLSDGESTKTRLADFPNLFILKAFTKTYGMAGLRLGYCLCSDPALLKAMSKQMQPWNVSIPAQAAGIAALQENEFLQRTKAIICEERCYLSNELQNFGFSVCPSDANFILFFAPPHLDQALRSRGIAIRNCSNYPALCDGWFRIAVRTHAENEALIAAIAQLKKEFPWQKTL